MFKSKPYIFVFIVASIAAADISSWKYLIKPGPLPICFSEYLDNDDLASSSHQVILCMLKPISNYFKVHDIKSNQTKYVNNPVGVITFNSQGKMFNKSQLHISFNRYLGRNITFTEFDMRYSGHNCPY